jgi:hypothetical protein
MAEKLQEPLAFKFGARRSAALLREIGSSYR